MPEDIPAASAAPANTSFSSGSADTGTPAASSAPDTSMDLTALFTQAEQATPASPDPSAPGVPATQGQAPATQGEGPQTTAPTAPVDGVTPPAGEAPAATAPQAETPQAPAPAPAPSPQDIAAQQELAQLRAQNEIHTMAAELGIHPTQMPAWGQYAKDLGFENNIRAAFAFDQEVKASAARITQNEEALIAPYVNDGYSEEDARAAVRPMQEQFARTEQMLVENKRIADTSKAQLEEMRATEARVQQEAVQRERQEAVQYAGDKWGVALPENTAKIFAGSPAESIRLITDDMETIFQSRLASERSKWAAASQERANTTVPLGADVGTAPASNPLANAAVNAPDLATIFETNHRNGSMSAFG